MDSLLSLLIHPFTDADPFGLMRAPGISWFGTVAIFVFAVMVAMSLWVKTRRALRPLVHVSGQLETISRSAWKIDREGLFLLDSIMEREARLRPYWRTFRDTLLPGNSERGGKIYSTRSAEEFFTWDALLGQRLNLAFYASIPGFVVGLGLLLTFVAILIGLYELQIQGLTRGATEALVRGLSGKFLTSIMALACSSVFFLEEKMLSHRMACRYDRFIQLLNELFTRRTLEQILDEALAKLTPPPAAEASEESREAARAVLSAFAQLSGQSLPAAASPEAVQHTLEQLKRQVKDQQRERIGGETAKVPSPFSL
jgi:hypothetical protein